MNTCPTQWYWIYFTKKVQFKKSGQCYYFILERDLEILMSNMITRPIDLILTFLMKHTKPIFQILPQIFVWNLSYCEIKRGNVRYKTVCRKRKLINHFLNTILILGPGFRHFVVRGLGIIHTFTFNHSKWDNVYDKSFLS